MVHLSQTLSHAWTYAVASPNTLCCQLCVFFLTTKLTKFSTSIKFPTSSTSVSLPLFSPSPFPSPSPSLCFGGGKKNVENTEGESTCSEPVNALGPHFPCPLPLAVPCALPSIPSLTPTTPVLHVRLACWTRQFLMHWKFTPWSDPVLTGAPGEFH